MNINKNYNTMAKFTVYRPFAFQKAVFLTCIGLFSCFLMTFAQPEPVIRKDHPKQPNILIIMADDLDSRQLSCYGGQNIVTHHIDELAEQGLKFNQVYCSEAMCVPTRASLFTGLYPVHHGSFQNHKGVYPNIQSICQYLGKEGYKVGLTGKNHSTRPRSVFPFDIIKGFEPSCVSATDHYFLDSVREYIRNKDQPFCLFVMSINPHKPWSVGDPSKFDPDKIKLPPNLVDTKMTRTDFCKYLAEIRELDNQVGDVMQMLKESGQYENTIVIFLGEQGPQFPGGKWTNWDYGLKSSMIIKWDGVITPGSETNALVQYEDITPTLIDIAGGMPIRTLDGRSFLSVIQGESTTFRQYGFGIHNNIPEGHAYPIRSIWDGHYKLIMNLTSQKDFYLKYIMNPKRIPGSYWGTWLKAAKHSKKAKTITERYMHRPAIEFYDTRKDPYELNNLALEKQYQDTIQNLTIRLQQWMSDQGDKGAAMDIKYRKRKQKKK